MNPFRYGQVVTKRDYCPRPGPEKVLRSCLESRQNIVIDGERRVGKTSMVCETVRKEKKWLLLYIDLLQIKSVDDLCQRMIKAFISMEQKAGFLEKVMKTLAHLKPSVTMDPLTGTPSVSVDAMSAAKPESIEGILDLIQNESDRRSLVVVLDEFQDILNLRDSPAVQAVMRGKIQFHSQIPYVFLGSIRNRMNEIFSSSDSPFFKSASSLHLGPIEEKDFIRFLSAKFKKSGMIVDKAFFKEIFVVAQNTPGDIQELCAALWDCSEAGGRIDAKLLPAAFELIFSREIRAYEAHLMNISAQQQRCLAALARKGGASPFSAEFMQASSIAQPGSIKKALNRLAEQRLIYRIGGEYKFVNPFFKEWLIYSNY